MSTNHAAPDPRKLAALLARVEISVAPTMFDWPGGWPDEVEAALLDAVFSVQARYGGPHTGVRRVVLQWRTRRGVPADDLSVLAGQDPTELASIVGNRAQAARRLKAEIAVDAARSLVSVGLRHADDFNASDEQRRAWLAVRGCGPVTWAYFGMLLGRHGVKADTWIMRFVRAVVGPEVDTHEAESLIRAAAEELRVSPTALDHAIWLSARSRNATFPLPALQST